MNREKAIEQFLNLVREKVDGSTWLQRTTIKLVDEGNLESFRMHCMSMAKKLLDGSMPNGSVNEAIERLWSEMRRE